MSVNIATQQLSEAKTVVTADWESSRWSYLDCLGIHQVAPPARGFARLQAYDRAHENVCFCQVACVVTDAVLEPMAQRLRIRRKLSFAGKLAPAAFQRRGLHRSKCPFIRRTCEWCLLKWSALRARVQLVGSDKHKGRGAAAIPRS